MWRPHVHVPKLARTLPSPREPRLPGSEITGVAEIAAATLKRVTLELGGKPADVILPGADLGTATGQDYLG